MNENKELRNKLIAISLVFIVASILIKNWSSISIKNLFGKGPASSEDLTGKTELVDDGENVRYGVSSANPIVSEVGMKVLEDGGNAVDAAVAMSFTLSVVDPQNSGIGGGGGMLIKDAITGREVFYDYYISSGDTEPYENIGIPGFLKGMETINGEMGTMRLSELIQYAIDIGEQGVTVTKGYEDILNKYSYIAQVHPSFNKDGRTLVEGEVLQQPELMDTFKEIQENGADIFYNGEHEISKNFLEMTGISPEALRNYKVHKYDPLKIDYMGYEVIAPPAPFSGLTVLQNLIIEENIDMAKHDFSNEDYNNTMGDLLVYTGKEGRKHIADPNFTNINYEELLDSQYLVNSFNENRNKNLESEDLEYEEPESVSTTGFTVVDRDGTIVAGTNTLSNYWGSYVVKDGIIYNNAMKNFTNRSNKFEYNKRPKTGIAPVIITNEEGHKEAIASNGGAKIPTYIFRAIVNSKKHGIDIQTANDMERMYYFKGQMYFEANAPYSVNPNEYINSGYDFMALDSSDGWGLMNGIEIKANGDIQGHSDRRNYFEGGSIYYNGTEKVYN